MVERMRSSALAGLLAWALLLPYPVLSQSPVAVLYTEGVVHGFLVLRTLEGDALAEGDVTEVARGDRVTSHMRLLKNMTGYTNFLARSFRAWVCFDRWRCRSSRASRRVTYAS